MTDSDRRRRGVQVFRRVYGEVLQTPVPPAGQNRSFDFMLETLFGDLWCNEILSFKERRLLVLGAIAAQGVDTAFAIHAESAVNNGEISVAQLQETLLFLIQYVGYPRASKLAGAVDAIARKYG